MKAEVSIQAAGSRRLASAQLRRFLILASGAGIAAAAPAWGQDASGEAAEVDHLAEVKSCRALSDDAARLACFDSAVGTMIAATESGDLQVIDREEVTKTRRSLFGFSLPKLGVFGSNDDQAEELLESQITEVRRIRRNAWVITITEGSKWQINNAPSRMAPPRVGNPVVFKKAAMGSFFIRVDGQTGVKGRRIE